MSRNRNQTRGQNNTPDAELAREFAPQIQEFLLLGRDPLRTLAPHGEPRLTIEEGVVFEATRNDSPRFTRELWIPVESMEPFAALITEETFEAKDEAEKKAKLATVLTGGFIRKQFSILEADLGGQFRSLVNPATRRFTPVPGADHDVLVSWQYKRGDRGQWMRRGMALPLDLARTHKSVYVPPPATPEEWNVLFLPATDERGNVTPTAILENGYVLELKRTHAHVLDGKWGERILVRIGNENPFKRTVICSSRTVIGSALGEAVDAVEPVVGDDQVLVQGTVHDVWSVLKPFGATDKQSVAKLTKLRRGMEMKLHPDTHGPSKAFKAMGKDVPAPIERKRKLDLELYRAAFARAEEIALATHGETGGESDPEPKAAGAPKPTETRVEPAATTVVETTAAAPEEPKKPRRPAARKPVESAKPRKPGAKDGKAAEA